MSRKSTRINFSRTTLNGIEVFVSNTRNSYLQAPSSEKQNGMCGAQFELEHIGKRALIRKAARSGKAAGREFRKSSQALHVSFELQTSRN